MVSGKQGFGEGRVDTVFVDRAVPSGGIEQRASGGIQQPQQEVRREEGSGGVATPRLPIPIPIPIIIPHKKTKVVQDTTLQDSVRTLEAENQKLRHEADSLKNDTTPMGVYRANAGLLDTTALPPGVRPEDYAFILNDLLAERIATLERYIEVMDDKGSASETDSLQRRIAMMDVELEKLRGKGEATSDGAALASPPGKGETLMDSVSFSLGSSKVGSADRTRLLAMGKRIAAGKVERVLVTGQTDRSGNPALNLQLSQKRADAVKRVLVEAGVPSATITAKGLGEKLAQDVHNESERIVVVQAVLPAK